MIIFLIAFAYLLGSIPFGLIFAQMFVSVDLRRIGSGNIGATNARRAGGWALGLATLACDISKGAVPVLIAQAISHPAQNGLQEIIISVTAVAAFCGHLFPVYLKFKASGKGVATAAGCFAVISPASLALATAAFLVAVILSKRVSAGSLAAAVCLPIGVIWMTQSLVFSTCALVISLAMIVRHKDNIQRLIAGTEPTIKGE